MFKFIIYSRKSRDAQDSRNQYTFATSEWHINNYLKQLDAQGIPYEVVGSYEETISGGGYYTNRPIFRSIVERCRNDRSLTLLVAKADRAARNLRSGTELMETINLVLANAPDADDMQKQLEFMIAEREYKTISQRFSDTYKAKKARCEKEGVKCVWGGNSEKWKITYNKNKSLGLHNDSSLLKKNPNTEALASKIENIAKRENYRLTSKELADNLNSYGITTATGKSWSDRTLRIFAQRNVVKLFENQRSV